MLIEFTVGNFRSFREPVTLSMVAANISSADKSLDENNVFPVDDDLSLLSSAAIYGANASGKSNLAFALFFFRWFVRNSTKALQDEDPIPIEPFRLSTNFENQPSVFEVVFLLDGRRYRYGFEVTQQRVIAEWLFMARTAKETRLFMREGDKITLNEKTFREGRQLADKTRPNALFVSVVAQFNGSTAKKILQWFRAFNVISGLNDNYLDYTLNCIDQGTNKEEIYEFIRKLDLSIGDFRLEKLHDRINGHSTVAPEVIPHKNRNGELPAEREKPRIPVAVRTAHPKFDADGRQVGEELFDLSNHESEGTRKLFAFAGPLVDTLKHGKRLFIDEMDARLHPLISSAIVRLFHSKESNPKGAQLIFVTHDTNLLSNRMFRRDQIWFAEKDRQGATHLYSLVEYRLENGTGVRNDALFENDYIRGRYGAVPFLGDLAKVFTDLETDPQEALAKSD